MEDTIELWNEKGNFIASVESAIVPTPGSLINVMQKDYKVKEVHFAIDYADDPRPNVRKMRSTVVVRKVTS